MWQSSRSLPVFTPTAIRARQRTSGCGAAASRLVIWRCIRIGLVETSLRWRGSWASHLLGVGRGRDRSMMVMNVASVSRRGRVATFREGSPHTSSVQGTSRGRVAAILL